MIHIKHLPPAIFLLMGLFVVLPGQAQENPFEGKYELLDNPQPTDNTDKIEVRELFWYNCPHCFALHKEIQPWLAKLPPYVDFVLQPAVFNQRWKPMAKAFYTAEALGILEQIHDPLFRIIHEQKVKMDDVERLKKFFAERAGVGVADFQKAYDSFTVDSKVRRANVLSVKYGVTGVPAIIVNGKYRVPNLSGYKDMLDVINYLIAKEYQQMQATKAEGDVPAPAEATEAAQ